MEIVTSLLCKTFSQAKDHKKQRPFTWQGLQCIFINTCPLQSYQFQQTMHRSPMAVLRVPGALEAFERHFSAWVLEMHPVIFWKRVASIVCLGCLWSRAQLLKQRTETLWSRITEWCVWGGGAGIRTLAEVKNNDEHSANKTIQNQRAIIWGVCSSAHPCGAIGLHCRLAHMSALPCARQTTGFWLKHSAQIWNCCMGWNPVPFVVHAIFFFYYRNTAVWVWKTDW